MARKEKEIAVQSCMYTKTGEKVARIMEVDVNVVSAKVVTNVMYLEGGMAYDEGGRTEVETRNPQWAADRVERNYGGFFFYDVLEMTVQLPDGTEVTTESHRLNVSGKYYIDFTELDLDVYASRGENEAWRVDQVRQSSYDVGLAERVVHDRSVIATLREGDQTIKRTSPS